MFLYHRYTLLSVRMRVALRSVRITIQEPKVIDQQIKANGQIHIFRKIPFLIFFEKVILSSR